jgi:hypothetical protein
MRDLGYRLSLVVILLIPSGEFIDLPFLGSASRIGGALLAVVWLVAVGMSRRLRKPATFHGALLALVLWNGLSIWWSVDPDSSVARTESYFRMLLFTVILWDLYTSTDRVRAGLQALALGAYLPVLSTIHNFFTGVETSWGRYSAAGSNPNTTATIIALAMPVAWHLATSQPAARWTLVLRFLNYAFVPTAVLAMALTGTRFALIMSVPTLIFCATTALRSGRLSWATIAVLAFLAMSLSQVMSVIPETSLERLSTIPEEVSEGDLNERRIFWQEGVSLWFDHPFVGVGANSFERATESGRAAHNSFISILAELGLVGFALFGLVLAHVVVSVWQRPSPDRIFWICVCVAWLLGNLALTYAHTRATWLLFGLVVASGALHTRRHGSPSEGRPDESPVPLDRTIEAYPR